jgi:hypothetical protein
MESGLGQTSESHAGLGPAAWRLNYLIDGAIHVDDEPVGSGLISF